WSIGVNQPTELMITARLGSSTRKPRTTVFALEERFCGFGRIRQKIGSIQRQYDFIDARAIRDVRCVGCVAQAGPGGRSKLDHTIRRWSGSASSNRIQPRLCY